MCVWWILTPLWCVCVDTDPTVVCVDTDPTVVCVDTDPTVVCVCGY